MDRRGPERFQGRKPVQVVLTPEEFGMVKEVADSKGISIPDAIRRAIYLQEWVGGLRRYAEELERRSQQTLVLGCMNNTGEMKMAIPIKLIPLF